MSFRESVNKKHIDKPVLAMCCFIISSRNSTTYQRGFQNLLAFEVFIFGVCLKCVPVRTNGDEKAFLLFLNLPTCSLRANQ